jgi:hypothetical protein
MAVLCWVANQVVLPVLCSKQYSAERMSLVVLGGEDLDTQEQRVRALFGGLPHGKGPRPSFKEAGMPYKVRAGAAACCGGCGSTSSEHRSSANSAACMCMHSAAGWVLMAACGTAGASRPLCCSNRQSSHHSSCRP